MSKEQVSISTISTMDGCLSDAKQCCENFTGPTKAEAITRERTFIAIASERSKEGEVTISNVAQGDKWTMAITIAEILKKDTELCEMVQFQATRRK